jgi:hypothetical protein
MVKISINPQSEKLVYHIKFKWQLYIIPTPPILRIFKPWPLGYLVLKGGGWGALHMEHFLWASLHLLYYATPWAGKYHLSVINNINYIFFQHQFTCHSISFILTVPENWRWLEHKNIEKIVIFLTIVNWWCFSWLTILVRVKCMCCPCGVADGLRGKRSGH